MHQSHNVPWTIIDKHFKFVVRDTSYTPARSGLASRQLPNAVPELKHFVRKFRDTIRTFSDTERAKYPAKFDFFPTKDFRIFSDELMAKYPEYLTAENQRIEFWIERGERYIQPENTEKKLQYTTSDGQLADVVKILIHANEMETLLMLANHPLIPLRDLNYLSWGHHFGFSRVKESAVQMYLFVNCMDATGMLWNGKYTDSDDYESNIKEATQSMDYPAQQAPHIEFLKKIRESGWDEGRGYKVFARSWHTEEERAAQLRSCPAGTHVIPPPLVHRDPEALKDYMKHLFALMYRYDMLARECGFDPEWEAQIVAWRTPFHRILEVTSEWDEVERKWHYSF